MLKKLSILFIKFIPILFALNLLVQHLLHYDLLSVKTVNSIDIFINMIILINFFILSLLFKFCLYHRIFIYCVIICYLLYYIDSIFKLTLFPVIIFNFVLIVIIPSLLLLVYLRQKKHRWGGGGGKKEKRR